jgi:UDP-2-acetamido-3-amino-2,3-dideoxy-glucuronate N-acetyltransferase
MSENKYFVHPNALVESDDIGKDTRIWSFAHVLKNVKIGEDCNLCDYVFVESGVTIGNRVTIKNGIAVWTGVTIEDDVFLGPFCVLTNDFYPRSKIYSEHVKTLIKKGASVGANATIICGNELGRYCMIGAGAVVTKNVRDFELVIGNPAKFKYWVGKTGEKLSFNEDRIATDSIGNKYKITINKSDASKNCVKEL